MHSYAADIQTFRTTEISTEQVQIALRKINPHKAADDYLGPACANELPDVLTSIFNLCLSQSTVPMCFKTTIIVPLLKKSPATCLNDYRPVACTPIVDPLCVF